MGTNALSTPKWKGDWHLVPPEEKKSLQRQEQKRWCYFWATNHEDLTFSHRRSGARTSLLVFLLLFLGVMVHTGFFHGRDEFLEQTHSVRFQRDRLKHRVLLKPLANLHRNWHSKLSTHDDTPQTQASEKWRFSTATFAAGEQASPAFCHRVRRC